MSGSSSRLPQFLELKNADFETCKNADHEGDIADCFTPTRA